MIYVDINRTDHMIYIDINRTDHMIYVDIKITDHMLQRYYPDVQKPTTVQM